MPTCVLTSEPLVTPDEIGEIVRLDKNTILKMARQRVIPSVRLNCRTIRFRLSAVLAALENRGSVSAIEQE
jgi:excisionase family DNA binding protein